MPLDEIVVCGVEMEEQSFRQIGRKTGSHHRMGIRVSIAKDETSN